MIHRVLGGVAHTHPRMNSLSRAAIRLPGSGFGLRFLIRAIIALHCCALPFGLCVTTTAFSKTPLLSSLSMCFPFFAGKASFTRVVTGDSYLHHPQTPPRPGPDSTPTAGLRTQTPPPRTETALRRSSAPATPACRLRPSRS